ncbi:TIGR03808 family TAT-translocated repetitive protein [Hyphomicrobium sp. LHD-15]|uniref:TIGR03808 family TAT-translocated repetitive protein n=1 Tax=Hyphomicrobium sp. LHD-15 TaxID=3072142 RepID=UPI00280F0B4B|nr:TIGR03808 family TAT-translocated repetitive protein [Hyphomicrobium sp. LHD-15]MDQ8698306.1 TIGR03808 family TAT-translocated repetitive protein [Hyphomicrobium sp. LHD-15]
MPLDRRTLLSTGLVSTGLAAAGLSATAVAGPRPQASEAPGSLPMIAPVDGSDQTTELQIAVDTAAERGIPLVLPPGRFRVGHLELRPNTRLIGASRQTVLEFTGGEAFLTARGAAGVRLEALVIDGNLLGMDANRARGLIAFEDCVDLSLRDLDVRRGLLNGIALTRSSGSVTDCSIREMSQAGLMSLDALGLDVSHNSVLDCANNGIQIWRSSAGDDGSLISANRIERIAAKGGGSGENGNGINVYRAGGVLVSANQIRDCAYSAIRGNAANDIQMVGNACRGIGEVALYAEFGFEGALIANNLVADAASGIAVTNFNEGGRLAVVQGNLIRNLKRREHEPVDKRGVGIGIEADAAVSGNVIEGAPTAGIIAGWGPYLRDVAITGNLIRNAAVGILVTSDAAAGASLVSQNTISGARDGAIRAMDHGTPHGPDLALSDGIAGRVTLRGNLAV